jgi:uncharacterized membrane protein
MNQLMHMTFDRVDWPWWGFASWLVPMLLIAVLVGVAVWLVGRAARPARGAGPTLVGTGGTAPPDPALEAARMRYARGEIGRDDFLRLSGDLGGRTGDAIPPAPPDAPPAAGDDGEER